MSVHEGIVGLIEDLKMCKIPFTADCTHSIKIYYPSKDNCICRITSSEYSNGIENVNLFWEDHMDIGFTKCEAFMTIKEYHLKRRKKKLRFFLKRKSE